MKDNQRNQIHERLLKERIIFLGVPIDEDAATNVISKILYLVDADRNLPISLYVNSPGGSIPASFGIMDVMDQSYVQISTVCVGQASGTAAMIVAHGSKGTRFALQDAIFGLVPLQRYGRELHSYGKGTHLNKIEELVTSRLAQDTGKTFSAVHRDMQARLRLDAQGAVSYGLIDQVVNSSKR